MIVIGYPGIGKTTISKSRNNTIELESSLFKDPDGYRQDDWYKYYCNLAVDLSYQGNTVLISSHSDVVSYLLLVSTEPLAFVVPMLSAHDWWIHKLKSQLDNDPFNKNYTAYNRVNKMYFNDISDLIRIVSSTTCLYWCIDNPDYDLDEIISQLENGHSSNNAGDAIKVCSTCKNYIGCGDSNLCCTEHPDLVHQFTVACDGYS